MHPRNSFKISGQLVLGVGLVVLGLLLTLDSLDLIEAREYLRYWPVLLVAFGAYKLTTSEALPGRYVGFFFLLFGSVLLLDRLDVIVFRSRDWWPFFLMFLGGGLLLNALSRHRGTSGEAGSVASDSTINMFAVMGGFERRNNSQNFRGGEMIAIMGGCEVDLRKASIQGGEAVVDIFAFWGGVEIKVPEDWSVVVRGFPLMGAIEDKTQPPVGGPVKRLIVKGLVIMGGAEIMN